MRSYGTVSKWIAEKRFGFVRPDDRTTGDLFVHLSHLPFGTPFLNVGDRLSFDIEPNRNNPNLYRAVRVKLENAT